MSLSPVSRLPRLVRCLIPGPRPPASGPPTVPVSRLPSSVPLFPPRPEPLAPDPQRPRGRRALVSRLPSPVSRLSPSPRRRSCHPYAPHHFPYILLDALHKGHQFGRPAMNTPQICLPLARH